MINILTEVFTIRGSFRFFYELEEILGSGYLEQYAEQMIADCETNQDLATALVDMLVEERELILAYWLDAGLTEEHADQMYADLEKSLTFVEIGR